MQRVGPYVLSKTLGVGSTGRVKLGTHVELGHNVAVKIVSKEWLETRATLKKKIEREITLMKLIRHPNVLSLSDVYESDTELFLILEHVEGGELFDYLVKRGRLPEKEAVLFFQQIIAGLDFCHHHMICHRDLKPENLLLDSNLNVKIADFGMATLQPDGKFLETSCGSPHYASPEIIRGVKYDGAAADIWSCGVILYALVTGNLPFDDENIRKLLSKVKAGLYFMPSSLSPACQDLIRRMLVVDPEKRMPIGEIKKHPWFSMSLTTIPPSPPPIKMEPITDPDDVDPDIIANLKTLGWETEQELMDAIISPELNVEKVFYHLLFERKLEFLNRMDDGESGSDPSAPRRRADSFSSEFVNRRGGSAVAKRRSTLASSDDDTQSESEKGGPKKLHVEIPVQKMSLNEKPTIGSPRFHRRHLSDAKEGDSPASPLPPSSPKRSWFQNLFNFKQEGFTIQGQKTFAETLKHVQTLLESHNIKCTAGSKEGTLKCKLDSAGKEGFKNVKFRVDLVPAVADGEYEVRLIQQQGSTQSFRSIFDVIRTELRKDKA